MQLSRLLTFSLVSVTAVLGIAVKQPHISFPKSDKRPLALGPITHEFVKAKKPITCDLPNDTVEFGFTIGADEKPERAFLIVGPNKHRVEIPIKPTIKNNGELSMYKFSIAIDKLPTSLIHFATTEKESLTASLLLASENGGANNVYVELFDLNLVFTPEKETSLPKRFGALPEIHHIFHSDPKMVSPWFAQVFSLAVIGCLVGLVLVWFGTVSFDLRKVTNSIYSLGFIGCLIALEYVFCQYYLGTSIFKTLRDTFYIAGPGIWLGSKLLSRL